MKLENEQQPKESAGGMTTSCPRWRRRGRAPTGVARFITAATDTRQGFLGGTAHVLVSLAVKMGSEAPTQKETCSSAGLLEP